MFPHMFMHWLTARRARTFHLPLVGYPLCIAVVWVPSVLLGVSGSLEFPELSGPAANSVLVRLIDLHAPELLAGLLAAGVVAAVMSSLDSQALSLGTMFTRDVVRRHRRGRAMSEAQQVRLGRFFTAGVLVVTFALSLVVDRSIFKLGVWSFTGFASLLPVAVAVFWRRSTAVGTLASVLTTAVLWVYFFYRAWSQPGYTVGDSGVMPVAVILAASAAALVLGSLATRPPEPARLERFFPTSG
jgi:SSS family solute:Na+ symporter